MKSWIITYLWCPEPLAPQWWKLPMRAGYQVNMRTDSQKREVWSRLDERKLAKAGGAERLVANHYQGVVSATGVVIIVDSVRDFLEERDATCSWWIGMYDMPRSGWKAYGCESDAAWRTDLSYRAMMTMARGFMSAGAESLLVTSPAYLFLCSNELAKHWPRMVLPSGSKFEVAPLVEESTDGLAEQYWWGRTGGLFGGVTIHSGPTFDPATWDDSAFIAIDPTGLFRQKQLLEEITKRIIENGGRRLTLTTLHIP